VVVAVHYHLTQVEAVELVAVEMAQLMVQVQEVMELPTQAEAVVGQVQQALAQAVMVVQV
jgi:hypothetical protein